MGKASPAGVTVGLPVFDEAAALAPLLAAITQELRDAAIPYELVVVDDGSTDGSAEVARRASARVLQHTERRGYGAALKTLPRGARYEDILFLDGDGSYPPAAIPRLLARGRDADMVVAARTEGRPVYTGARRAARATLRRLASFLVGARIPDANSGMRLVRKRFVLADLDVLPDGFSCSTTMTVSHFARGRTVAFEPIVYLPRVGRSKLGALQALRLLPTLLRAGWLLAPRRAFAAGAGAVGLTSLVIATVLHAVA